MNTILIAMFLPLLFFLIGVAIYSFWFGTSWLGGILGGTAGGIAGGILNSFSEVGYIFSAGLSNFFQPGYWGMTLFALGVLAFMMVILFNILTTFTTSPDAIR